MAEFLTPLDIPDIEILKVENSKTDDLILTIKSTKSSVACRKCKKLITKCHGYGEALLLRHLPILDREVYIRIKPARYQCMNCDDHPTTTEQPDWYSRHSKVTKAYEEYLMRLLIGSTLSDVSRKEAITYDEIKGALNRQVSKEINWKSCPSFNLLGIDEISLKKGHKDFVTVVSTRIKGKTKILSILPDRKKNTVKSFIKGMPDENKKGIKTVCCDMYDGYINAAKEALGDKVKIVVDRFHVAKKYRECVDKLRKKELYRLKKSLTDEEYKKLKGAMWALRKKEENLKDHETEVLTELFSRSPRLEEAYNLQKALTTIFDTNYTKKQASKQIKNWIKIVEKSDLDCFDSFAGTLRNHWEEILNYFYRKGRKNSGFVEGLNNKIKTIKRRCYGIFNIGSLYQRIHLDLDGYEIYC